jgi:hypothetical protein
MTRERHNDRGKTAVEGTRRKRVTLVASTAR